MRFLVDAQLPPALARWLEERGHTAEHVADRGMAAADDRAVWEYALATGAVIVTKDEDFAMCRVLASEGPWVLWIRSVGKLPGSRQDAGHVVPQSCRAGSSRCPRLEAVQPVVAPGHVRLLAHRARLQAHHLGHPTGGRSPQDSPLWLPPSAEEPL